MFLVLGYNREVHSSNDETADAIKRYYSQTVYTYRSLMQSLQFNLSVCHFTNILELQTKEIHMERQPRSHADVTRCRRHASGNTQEFRTEQTEKTIAEVKKHVEKLSKVVDGVEYFVGNILTKTNLMHILKSENARIKSQQSKLYYLEKCASHNENTQKWITKDANTEGITMKGVRIKMPMLSAIEVATVADTSKQADKSPTTANTTAKTRGRPSKM
jgi:hypothetical protein